IEDDLHKVMDNLATIEQEVENRDGRWFIMRIMPYRTLDNRIDGIVITFSDVTPLKLLESELIRSDALGAALNEISAEISASLDSEPVLPVVVKKASQAIGVEAGMITIPKNDQRMVKQAFGLLHLRSGMELTDEDTPYLKLIEHTMKPIAIQDVEADGRVSRSFAETYGIRSVLGVPLVAGGEFAGVLSMICTTESRKFSDTDIGFALKIGTAVSLALNNIQIYDAQIKAKDDAEDARRLLQDHHDMLQLALLPSEMYKTSGYDLATRFVPGATGKYIGGDFYDVFKIEDGRTAFLIGDVTGKGVEAASLAVAVRSTIRAFAYDLSHPDQALSHANAVTYPQSHISNRFSTVFLAILDPQTGAFTYANAGHPPMMILRSGGEIELLNTGQLPIGIDSQIQYESFNSQLLPGDKLVMYTDGISEAHTGTHMLDIDGICNILEKCLNCTPEELLANLFNAALDYSEEKLDDDAVVVIIQQNA
ncbi:MAG: GAF domain-containing SpoIIE family protein phosphatase, partial [Armatimonadota bacterium]